MSNDSTSCVTGLGERVAAVAALRRFDGSPAEFWPSLASALGRLCGAARAVLVVGNADQPQALRRLAEWTDGTAPDPVVRAFTRALPAAVVRALQEGESVEDIAGGVIPGAGDRVIAVRLAIDGGAQQCAVALLVRGADDARVRELKLCMAMATDVPAQFQAHHAQRAAGGDSSRLASVLDVLGQVAGEGVFQSAALALVNGIAGQLACERVALGWIEGPHVRLQVLSRSGRFDPKMAVVQSLECAMEEAFDQDDELVWPPVPGHGLVTRAHGVYAREQGVAHVLSVPLRFDGRPVGVLTCERQEGAFSDPVLQQLRLLCDQIGPRLRELHRDSGWLGARWLRSVREGFGRLLGPDHTWAKLGAVAGGVAAVGLLLPICPYRVEGTFVLRSSEVSHLSAPFDGFIRSVHAQPGDALAAGAVLVQLDTDQLALEEAAAIADQTRYLREAEKARAARQLAEMRIAQSQADQAASRLGLVRHRLEQARLKAPFEGVVVEGDLRQRISAPVRQGDPLIRFARVDRLHVEGEIPERDVHEVLGRNGAEIAFVARPKSTFHVRIEAFESAAQVREAGNVFRFRGVIDGTSEAWFRPGMSGVCKVPAGQRPLGWILLHRTVDFLRMYLWW
jgi:multidrug resistance efflux pump